MRMFRHLPACAATATLLFPGAALHAAEDGYAVLPNCPGDPDAMPATPLGKTLSVDDIIQGIFEPGFTLDTNTGEARAANGAAISQGDRKLSATDFSLSSSNRRVEVRGSVQYSDPQIILQGDAGSFSDDGAEFEGTTFTLPQQPARGGARSLSLDNGGILQLKDLRYTTCPEGHDDWLVRADSLAIDTNKGVGVARDARVQFFGVTLLRLPYISFPVGDARKSGLLFPSIGTSTNSGAQLSVPYYVNIAPNQDLTLTPTWYSSRGFDIEGEYRFLTRSSRGTLLANVLPSDRKADRTRTRFRIGTTTTLPLGWRLTLDAADVSDTRYFEDFAQGADGASIAFLPRRVQLSYRSENLDAGVMLRNFQTLDRDLALTDRPHTELPRLYARGNWQAAGALPLNYGFDSELVMFRHDDAVQGWRLDAMPQVSLNYAGAGYFLKPAVAIETTHYKLRDVPSGTNRSPGRTLPLISLDGGLLFERDNGKRGQRRVTLEPRLMYLYVPHRNQSDLPVFDTAEPDLNWVELFRTNRYSGIDRVSDANQLSTGLTTRLFSGRTGARFLSMTIGQTFYFETPRVALPDEPTPTGHSSDLTAEVELQAFKNWSVSSALQWDPQTAHTGKAEAHVRYQPEPRSVVNVGYRFQRDRQEQVDFSAAWPLSDQWRVYGRSLYSLRDNKSIEHFAGFEFSSCCWNVRLVARDYVSRRSGDRDRSIYLQLELKGLSNVGLAADAFLEKAIRGYSTTRRRH
jgi:LPS-assembly protein